MKKVAISIMVLMLTICLLAFPGCASEGEVEVDLVQYGTENIVGSATLNTTTDLINNSQLIDCYLNDCYVIDK